MEKAALVAAAFAGLLVTLLSGFLLVPFLRKLKFGQTINEIGPSWHKNKQGTPTMGGFMFILGSFAGLLVAFPFLMAYFAKNPLQHGLGLLALCVFTSFAFGFIGFIDDYLKVVRHQNLGLNSRQKLFLQFLVACCFLLTLHLMGRLSPLVRLPFFGLIDFGFLFYPLSLVFIVGVNNAVNLTDGVDGLCATVTSCVMGGFLVILAAFSQFYLAAFSAAVAGACVGFLFWNFYPAKVFMGDTGSLFLGGAVVCVGYCMGRPDVLGILALLYLAEALSVIIQRYYFKLTHGKRIFKMSPIHHHFELSGWSEVKIVAVFSGFTVLCGVGAYWYACVLG